MRAERMLLRRNPKNLGRLIPRLRQRGQLWSIFNAHPEYARRFRGWEKTISAKIQFYFLNVNRRQSLLDLLDRVDWFFTDEFQGYVQRLRPYPSGLRGESTQPPHERA